jgi:hypothetical protein
MKLSLLTSTQMLEMLIWYKTILVQNLFYPESKRVYNTSSEAIGEEDDEEEVLSNKQGVLKKNYIFVEPAQD